MKDKELDADRKEKHMEEKFKPEECAFGEASSELDRVVTAMAESRVLYLSRQSGKPDFLSSQIGSHLEKALSH